MAWLIRARTQILEVHLNWLCRGRYWNIADRKPNGRSDVCFQYHALVHSNHLLYENLLDVVIYCGYSMPSMLFSMIHLPLKNQAICKGFMPEIKSFRTQYSKPLPTQLSVPRSGLRPFAWCRIDAYLDSILPLRKVNSPLLRLLQNLSTLRFAQASSNGTCLLWSEVEREVLLVLIEETKLRALIGINDCEDLCDWLSEIVAVEGEFH